MRFLISLLVVVVGCDAATETPANRPASSGTAYQAPPAVAPSTTTATPAARDSGNWVVDVNPDPMDNVTNVTLQLESNAPLDLAFPYSGHYASLVIRCRKGKTDLYVHTETPVKTSYDSDYDDLGSHIRYRIDGGKPTGEYWSEATDNEAVFSPNPISLARRLAKAKIVLFEFTPFDAASTTVSFDVNGLQAVLPRLAEACHWK
jgi:hypothetical protein